MRAERFLNEEEHMQPWVVRLLTDYLRRCPRPGIRAIGKMLTKLRFQCIVCQSSGHSRSRTGPLNIHQELTSLGGPKTAIFGGPAYGRIR